MRSGNCPLATKNLASPSQDNWITSIFGHIEVAPIFTVEIGDLRNGQVVVRL